MLARHGSFPYEEWNSRPSPSSMMSSSAPLDHLVVPMTVRMSSRALSVRVLRLILGAVRGRLDFRFVFGRAGRAGRGGARRGGAG